VFRKYRHWSPSWAAWIQSETTLFLMNHFNIIFSSPPRSSKRSLPFTFPNTNILLCIAHLFLAWYISCTSHPLYIIIIPIIFGEENKPRSFSLRRFPQPLVAPSVSGPSLLSSTLISNTFSLCSYLISWTKLHIRAKQLKIYRYIMHILIFTFLDFR
jgi:hypothetical protein